MPVTSITSASIDEQFNWIRIDNNIDGTYNIEGGFKPNDLEATGQNQVSEITVTYEDGYQEIYSLKRKRQSIPVVRVAGRYWMKYNVRGNPNSYEDQIQHSEDKENLYEYLKTCSDEKFIYYTGAQYKGQNKTPLYPYALDDESGILLRDFENISNTSDQGTAGKSFFVPPGFVIPNKSEWRTVAGWGLNVSLQPGYTAGFNHGGYALNFAGHRRDLIVDEKYNLTATTVFNINEPSVMPSGVIFIGVGHQMTTTNYNYGEIIYILRDSKNESLVFKLRSNHHP